MQISAAGISTNYQQLGRRGPLLVLLHGWGCSWEIFSPILTELSKTYQVIVPDLPGFGLSAVPTANSKNLAWDSLDYLVWLKDFLKKTVDNQPFVIGGHSFGGKLAALLAATQSQTEIADRSMQLKGLILIDSAGLPAPLTPKEQLSYALSGWVPSFVKQAIPTALKRKVLASADIAVDYQAATPQLQAILKRIVRENIGDNLRQITLPTLICWGALDETTPVNQAEAFAKAIFDNELVIFDQSQHYPFVDQPAKFIATVTSFLTTTYEPSPPQT
jgi:pimeloyl-ACP methyl ester carboxylesterase